MAPPESDEERPNRFRLSNEFWIAVVSLTIGLGTPAVMWGGRMDSRMDNVESQQRNTRAETREDLREINRKLDVLMEKVR